MLPSDGDAAVPKKTAPGAVWFRFRLKRPSRSKKSRQPWPQGRRKAPRRRERPIAGASPAFDCRRRTDLIAKGLKGSAGCRGSSGDRQKRLTEIEQKSDGYCDNRGCCQRDPYRAKLLDLRACPFAGNVGSTVLIRIDRSDPTQSFSVGCGASFCIPQLRYPELRERQLSVIGDDDQWRWWFHSGETILAKNGSALDLQ
jgi:hypothetical protein